MLHILFSILISLGSASGFVVKDSKNLEKTHDVEVYHEVLMDIGEDAGGW